MAVFVILSLGHARGEIEAAIQKHFPNDSYDLGEGRWFIAVDTPTVTAKRLSNKLGITRPNKAEGLEAVVLGVNGYFGFADTEIWEWLNRVSRKDGA